MLFTPNNLKDATLEDLDQILEDTCYTENCVPATEEAELDVKMRKAAYIEYQRRGIGY